MSTSYFKGVKIWKCTFYGKALVDIANLHVTLVNICYISGPLLYKLLGQMLLLSVIPLSFMHFSIFIM